MQLSATLKPSRLNRQLRRGHADSSESCKTEVMAKRLVLGRLVEFYTDGSHHIVTASKLSKDEQYHSELLRFCHASLVSGQPIGHKSVLWVDASRNPVLIYICGLEASQYLSQVHTAINCGVMPAEMVLDRDDETVPTMKGLTWQV